MRTATQLIYSKVSGFVNWDPRRGSLLCYTKRCCLYFAANDRWVEIMMVYHALRGFEDLQKDNVGLQELQQNSDRFLFANYRLVCRLTVAVRECPVIA